MKPILKTLLRTTLFALGGALFMYGAGPLYLLTAGQCSAQCQPEISTSLGVASGLLAAWMVRPNPWKSVDPA